MAIFYLDPLPPDTETFTWQEVEILLKWPVTCCSLTAWLGGTSVWSGPVWSGPAAQEVTSVITKQQWRLTETQKVLMWLIWQQRWTNPCCLLSPLLLTALKDSVISLNAVAARRTIKAEISPFLMSLSNTTLEWKSCSSLTFSLCAGRGVNLFTAEPWGNYLLKVGFYFIYLHIDASPPV